MKGLALGLWAFGLSVACRASQPAPAAPAEVARLYPGYSGYHRHVGTDSDDAQRWFDQGLQLVYGFNHDEATRSFAQRMKSLPVLCAISSSSTCTRQVPAHRTT